MKTILNIRLLVFALTFVACSDIQTGNKVVPFDSLFGSKKIDTIEEVQSKISSDTIYALLLQSLRLDTFEFVSWEPFLYLKTGNFLSSYESNAVIITCTTDSRYKVEYYSKSADSWIRNDQIELPDAFPFWFLLRFEDFNFDGQKDMYLQTSVSNSYALSRGHLLTIDPETKTIVTHPETRALANMHIDVNSKTVISEDVIWDVDKGFQGVCDLKSRWRNGKLEIIKKECPSKNPQGY